MITTSGGNGLKNHCILSAAPAHCSWVNLFFMLEQHEVQLAS
jgi:hypothetical protein